MPGRETEDLCLDCLKHHGYETYQPPKAKYREQDVFGLFDVLGFGHGQLLAVQVKGGQEAAGINEWFEQVRPFDEHIDDLQAQFWHRKDGSWRIARPISDGWRWAYDGRKSAQMPYTRLRDLLR